MLSGFKLHNLRLTARFFRGYRYLDRAGEALIQLEDILGSDWVTTDISPKSGSMKNALLGMILAFNSEGANIEQSGVLSQPHFIDHASKAIDTLASVFDVNTYISPSVAAEYQKGFSSHNEPDAEKALRDLNLVSVSAKANNIVGPSPQALSYTILNKMGDRWRDVDVEHVCRLAVQVVRQAKRENPDTRLIARAKLLSARQRDAIEAIRAAQKLTPEVSPVALQVEFENRLEGEIARADFSCADFLADSFDWAKAGIDRITS